MTDFLSTVQAQLGLDNVWSTAVLCFVGTLLLLWLKSWWDTRNVRVLEASPPKIGDVTLEELSKYDASDPLKPILMAVKGKVYDVSKGRDFYGRGGGYAVFAGKEVARALGKMSLDPKDCRAELDDLSEKEMGVLADWEAKFGQKYQIVGQVVAPKTLTLEELIQFDGSDAAKPILLAIRGTIFDVSTGRDFYGPDGVYPFAGRECARAFALLSTDTADCHDNIEGLGLMEMDNLRDWEAKFQYKYPIVGTVKK